MPTAASDRPALWIAWHLPALSLEAWAATLPPEQQGRPLALLAGARLQAVNAEAARCGLQIHMKRATALALAPHTVFGLADAARDAQAVQAFAYAALNFTPSVALHGSDTVLLEVSTTQRVFGGLPNVIQQLKANSANWGFTQRLAVAPTAGAAALLARWLNGLAPSECERMLSLRSMKKLIDGAPIELMDAAVAHLDMLQTMGLSVLADLRAMPRDGLTRRFGQTLLAELDAIRGDAPQAHAWVSLPEHFEARLDLFARADTTEQVLYGAQVLLERLVVWARARRGRVRRFQLAMLHEPRHRNDDSTPERSVLELALAEPANDLKHMAVLLREHLARTPLPAPTLELRIACTELALTEAPSGELFPTRASEREGLLRLVERLQARLGRDAVRTVRAVADHRPERATRCAPLDVADWTEGAQAAKTSPAAASLTRPVWLFPQPQALGVRQSLPCLDGHPLKVLAGPERLESGWWDGALAIRDYFVAQAHDNSLVWIYRSRLPTDEPSALGEGAEVPDDSGWFLHGRFA